MSGLTFNRDNKSHTITISVEPTQGLTLSVSDTFFNNDYYDITNNNNGTWTINYTGWGIAYNGTLNITAADGTTIRITLSEQR